MNDDLILISSPAIRSDKVKNRLLLLETAKRLFAERGFEAVTMTDIANEAGVGKGTLYRNFAAMADLREALLDEDQRALQIRTLDYIRQHTDPVASLRWFVRQTLEFVDRNGALLCVGAGAVQSLTHPAHWWWRQTIRGLLAHIKPSVDIDFLADALYVLLDVHTVYFQRQHRGYSLDRIAEGIDELIARVMV